MRFKSHAPDTVSGERGFRLPDSVCMLFFGQSICAAAELRFTAHKHSLLPVVADTFETEIVNSGNIIAAASFQWMEVDKMEKYSSNSMGIGKNDKTPSESVQYQIWPISGDRLPRRKKMSTPPLPYAVLVRHSVPIHSFGHSRSYLYLCTQTKRSFGMNLLAGVCLCVCVLFTL